MVRLPSRPILCRLLKWRNILLLAMGYSSGAQEKTPVEGPTAQGVLNAAQKAFDDGVYELTDSLLERFSSRFPASTETGEAIMLQSQARLLLKRYESAVSLLTSSLKNAGKFEDDFRYWIGEARFLEADYAKAEEAFEALLEKFPRSEFALSASFRLAETLSRAGRHSEVVALLNDPAGAFRSSARAEEGKPSEIYALGLLLLGEAMFAEERHDDWLPVREELSKMKLSPDLYWRWEHLNCRNHLVADRFQDALDSSSNLVRLAEAAKDTSRLATSVSLLGESHYRLGKLKEAYESYQRNLGEGIPQTERREALLKTADLSMASNRFDDAIGQLEQFVKEFPKDVSIDYARLKLGQLFLAKTFDVGAGGAGGDGFLKRSHEEFNLLVTQHPKSPYLPVGLLGRAQCLELMNKLDESLADLKTASESLKPSEELATARFKMGDILVKKKELEAATTHYLYVFQKMTNLPQVVATMADRAGFQAIKTLLRRNDLVTAQGVAVEMNKRFGDRTTTGDSILLLSRALIQGGQATAARQLILGLGKGGERIQPELDLALAESFLADGDWTKATDSHEAWLKTYPNHESAPTVRFNLGWVYHQANKEGQAFQIYTNFASLYPTNRLVLSAMNWVADYYFRNGDIVNAELGYQKVFQSTNWPPSQLSWRARLMAGRAALERQGWNDARRYFEGLIQLEEVPSEIEAEAFFALGDLTVAEDGAESVMERFGNAINIFEKLTQRFPESRFVPLAWGRIADCHAQLASFDPKRHDLAVNFYRKVLAHPKVDNQAKSAAQFGLAVMLEAKARQQADAELKSKGVEEALNAYLALAYVEGFVAEGQAPDPFWTAKAVMEGGRMLEELSRDKEAVALYDRGRRMFPGYARLFDARIVRLKGD